MNARVLFVLMAAAWPALAAAQGTIYESKDKQGTVLSNEPTPGAMPVEVAPKPGVIYESQDKGDTVFSDQPSRGATELKLPPPNVVPGTPAPAQPAPPAASAPATPPR